MGLAIDETCDSFREPRESGACCIDKTLTIKRSRAEDFKSAVLFTFPRRFGKTLTRTMFRDFLDVRQSSRGILAGLEIMEHPAVVERLMNRYPWSFLPSRKSRGSHSMPFWNGPRHYAAGMVMLSKGQTSKYMAC